MHINTKIFLIALGAIVIVGAAGMYVMKPEAPAPEEDISAGGGLSSGSEMIMDVYFTQKMQAKADAFRAANPNLDVSGFSDGYSGFLYIKAFPGLKPSDFEGVIGRSFSGESGGEYSEREGQLSFMGHAASDSANIPAEGMATLLINISRRLSLPIYTEADVDVIIDKISK
jgi:hypothetical protein